MLKAAGTKAETFCTEKNWKRGGRDEKMSALCLQYFNDTAPPLKMLDSAFSPLSSVSLKSACQFKKK